MQKFRVIFMSALLIVGVAAVSTWEVTEPRIAHFSFLWDALLGVLLGVGCSWLPSLSGVQRKNFPYSGSFWVGAFLALILLCVQYLTQVIGGELFWLHQAGTRTRVVEGVCLGFCMAETRRSK